MGAWGLLGPGKFLANPSFFEGELQDQDKSQDQNQNQVLDQDQVLVLKKGLLLSAYTLLD